MTTEVKRAAVSALTAQDPLGRLRFPKLEASPEFQEFATSLNAMSLEELVSELHSMLMNRKTEQRRFTFLKACFLLRARFVHRLELEAGGLLQLPGTDPRRRLGVLVQRLIRKLRAHFGLAERMRGRSIKWGLFKSTPSPATLRSETDSNAPKSAAPTVPVLRSPRPRAPRASRGQARVAVSAVRSVRPAAAGSRAARAKRRSPRGA